MEANKSFNIFETSEILFLHHNFLIEIAVKMSMIKFPLTLSVGLFFETLKIDLIIFQ